MVFAIYGRKSVFSDKSSSIDNQFRMAREYIQSRFKDSSNILEYSDEDFTGANTNRPELQQLLADIDAGSVNVLVVYQLDRLSRDVKDFANIYSELEQKGVEFISVKEQIDTTTPIGKAMMYVTVVFAQMERETIAQRVSDNMLNLAKKGLWTGGNPPYGYLREDVIVNGKKHVTIVPDPVGVQFVQKVFDDFISEGGSLQHLETVYKSRGIKTQTGKFFSTTQMHKILTMPYCVQATQEVYDFYEAKGCIMDSDSPRERWDGTHGVIIYGRTTEKNKKHQLQPPECWTVCLGFHEPFMDAKKWLSVQEMFSKNKFDKTMKYDVPLLKGVLRCRCGSIMCVARKKKASGGVSSWYYCLKHMRQGEEACPGTHAIKIDILDEKVIEIFKSIEADQELIEKYSAQRNAPGINVGHIQKKIASTEKKIRKLAGSLAMSSSSTAAKYIVEEMERLDAELQSYQAELRTAAIEQRKSQEAEIEIKERAQMISELIKNFDSFTSIEKNEIVKAVVRECVWDGETLSLCL